MTTLEKVVFAAADQWPLIAVLAVMLWLSLPQLAERYAIIRKMVAPFSRRWQDRIDRMERERREVWMEEGKALVAAAIEQMTPRDVKAMYRRLERVEDAEELLKSYVIYDELWHFRDNHNEARQGRQPAHRMTFDTFERKWQEGWRPFDDDGHLVDDGTELTS